ncbi:hypothetical protein ACWGII_13960 [Streptomyces sp. NPDC054855]
MRWSDTGRTSSRSAEIMSGRAEAYVDPSREACVPGLVSDMTDLLDRFEEVFEAGNR